MKRLMTRPPHGSRGEVPADLNRETIDAPACGPVQFDLQHCIGSGGERVDAGAWLGVAVDRHCFADRRQPAQAGTANQNRVDAAAGDFEVNRVGISAVRSSANLNSLLHRQRSNR